MEKTFRFTGPWKELGSITKGQLPAWLKRILLDRRLTADQVVLILSIQFMPRDIDGSFFVKGRDLAYHCRTSDKTGTRALEGLDQLGILKITEKKEGRNGGFRFFVKNAAMLTAFGVFLLGGTNGGLHKQDYGTNGRGASKTGTEYILLDKRRKRRPGPIGARNRGRLKGSPTPVLTKSEWIARFGQLPPPPNLISCGFLGQQLR